MFSFEINEVTENFSLKIDKINAKQRFAFLEEIKKSFDGGEYLARLIIFKDDRIIIKLPLRFYYLGGKAFKKTYPFLEKIPPYFFRRMKNLDKWFGELWKI